MTIKTTIHCYDYNLNNAGDAKEYAELVKDLKATVAHPMRAIGDYYHPEIDGMQVELETGCLFDNQWNTKPIGASKTGYRVFDWAEEVRFNNGREIQNYRRGHYLTITDEMREIRRNTCKCGYCGHQMPAQAGSVFCPECLGSAYLTAEQVHLTRMMPVDTPFKQARAKLTEAEETYLMPLFRQAQIYGNTERDKLRIARTRAKIEKDYHKALKVADTEYHGMLWLMDHGIKTDNVIYYSHTDQWAFGWRTPYDSVTETAMRQALEGFPFPYEFAKAKTQ